MEHNTAARPPGPPQTTSRERNHDSIGSQRRSQESIPRGTGSTSPLLFTSASWALPTMASTPMGTPRSPTACRFQQMPFDESLFEIKQLRKAMLETTNGSATSSTPSARAANMRQRIQTPSRSRANSREQEKIELKEISDPIPESGIEALVLAFTGMEEEDEEDDTGGHAERNGDSAGDDNAHSLTIRTPTASGNRSWGNSWANAKSRANRGNASTVKKAEENVSEPRLTQLFVRESSFEKGTFRLSLHNETHLRTALSNVKEIRLSGCNLGSVPRELFELPALTSLDLSHNPLEALPDSFWECKSLRRLELQCEDRSMMPSHNERISSGTEFLNDLDGTKPQKPTHAQLLVFPPPFKHRGNQELPQLTYIDIRGCGVDEISDQIRHIPCLHTFKASGNNISCLPNELSSLKRLCIVEVEDNPLCSVPPSLTEKPGLELISGVPTEILPGLYLGDVKSARNSRSLDCRHVKRIVSVIESVDAVVQSGRDTLVVDVKDSPAEDLGFSDCPFPYFARFCLLPKTDTPSPSLLGLVAPEDDVKSEGSWGESSSSSRQRTPGISLGSEQFLREDRMIRLWEQCGIKVTKSDGQQHMSVPPCLLPRGTNPDHIPNVELHIANRRLHAEAKERLPATFADNFFGGEPVLIHCRAGVSRSATLAIALVMLACKKPLLSAFLHVKQRRGSISPNLGFYKQLAKFESTLLQNGILSSLHNDFHSQPDQTTCFPSMSVQEYLSLSSSLITADVWEARYGSRDAKIKFGALNSESSSAKLRSFNTFGDGIERSNVSRPAACNSIEATSSSADDFSNDIVGIDINEDSGQYEMSPPTLLPCHGNECFQVPEEQAPNVDSAPFSASTPSGQCEEFELGVETSASSCTISQNQQEQIGSIDRCSTTISTAWLFESDSTPAQHHASSMLLPPPMSTSWWHDVSKRGREGKPAADTDRPSKLEIQPSHISFFIWQADGTNKTAFTHIPMNASNRIVVNDTAQKLLRSNMSRHKLTETEAARLLRVAVPSAGGTGYFGVRNPYVPYNSISFGGLNHSLEKTTPRSKPNEQNVSDASSIASRNVRKVTSLMNLNSLDPEEDEDVKTNGHKSTNGGTDEQGDKLRLLLRPSLMYANTSHRTSWKERGRRGRRRNSFGI
eukprot:gb/GECG01015245.1/.p1 GENE.gb/GECG01015245.1/~~gb/GECG01015245.1/.p1  ORF type:complete len:1139 (+),score=127.55 gb/GECG01015245.1/:1-3417(+)